MKITNSILILAAAGLFLSFSTKAETKGAERLAQKRAPVAATPVDYKPMPCPSCKDTTVSVPDTNAKGAVVLAATGAPVKSVVKHGCDRCTTVAKAGFGKYAPYTVAHQCNAGAPSCCN